jgi:membrane protease subunit (stomatin/prohibitin family)
MGQEVHDRLSHDFQRYGLNLADFFITSITPPEEV